MGISKKIIEEIIRQVRKIADPDRIILFGSAATGSMTKGSDIDLLILEADPSNSREESAKIHLFLSGVGYPVDAIVMKTEWFEQSKNVIGGLAYPANKYGKVIYDVSGRNKTHHH